VKHSYVHCAELLLEAGSDPAAPGGAVTVELCGSWDHPGPCRWPHTALAEWEGCHGQVRVVFVAPAAEEAEVRSRIERALSGGTCLGPDGRNSRWTASSMTSGTLLEEEAALFRPD
jgi:hypothetical protein